jgi:hypothetical protein
LGQDNYSFKKRQRELAQKKKREEKLQRKLDKKNPPTEPVQAPSEDASASL